MSYLTALLFPIKVRKVIFFSGLSLLVLSAEIASQHGDGIVLRILLSQFCPELGYDHCILRGLPCSYPFRKISSDNQKYFLL